MKATRKTKAKVSDVENLLHNSKALTAICESVLEGDSIRHACIENGVSYGRFMQVLKYKSFTEGEKSISMGDVADEPIYWQERLFEDLFETDFTPASDYFKVIEFFVDNLDSRSRNMLLSYYSDRLSFADVGKLYGISKQGAQQHIDGIVQSFRRKKAFECLKYGMEYTRHYFDYCRVGAVLAEMRSNLSKVDTQLEEALHLIVSSGNMNSETCKELIAELPVDLFCLGGKMKNFCRSNDINILRDLNKFSEEDIIKMKGAGRSVLSEFNRLKSLYR